MGELTFEGNCSPMNSEIKDLIEKKDYDGVRDLLEKYPHLANEGITIPFDPNCHTPAHPLHRVCDAVFSKHVSDEEAVQFAKIFLQAGANIHGANDKVNEDTPLLAAASLHAEQLGIFYIDNGADIHYKGRHDGATALHWASYCGKDKLVQKLVETGSYVDERDSLYNSSPLGWAIHALRTGTVDDSGGHIACIRILFKAGADITALNTESRVFLENLSL